MKQIINLSLALLLGSSVGCGNSGVAPNPGSGSGLGVAGVGTIDGTWRMTGVRTTSGTLSLAQVTPLVGQYLEQDFNLDNTAAAGIRAFGSDLQPVLSIQNGSGSLSLTNKNGCAFRLSKRFQYSGANNGVGQMAMASPAGTVAVSGSCNSPSSSGVFQAQNLSASLSYQIQGNQLIISDVYGDGQRAWIYSR